MPRQSKKFPKRPAPRKTASEGSRSSSEPSKLIEAPPVPPSGQVSVRSAVGQNWPTVLDDAQFNVCWGQLSMRQKQKVREIAEVRGLGLRGVLNLFPGMRSG